MKFSHIFLLNIFFFYLTACANEQTSTGESLIQTDTSPIVTKAFQPDSFPVKKLITNVVCRHDASQSYALYIPSTKTNAVIYFFDPHAAGALPLEKYKALADAYNFVLIGSNNSKNGNDLETTEKIWQTLFNDTRSRTALNIDRVYVCGFSGGAKAAGYLAMNHQEIKAVIAGGAGLPDGTAASNFNFSFYRHCRERRYEHDGPCCFE
jgi:predicted peptidase